MMQEPPLNSFSAPLKILSLIIIMIASFLLVFLIGFVIAIPIFGLDMLESVSRVFDSDDFSGIAALKYFQVVNQIGVFIVPAFLFAFLTRGNVAIYLRLDRSPSFWIFISGLLVIFFALPFISWLIEINNAISLPEALSGVEDWFRRKEDEATKLTEIFLGTKSLAGLLLNLFMIAVLAAFGEELIFRGIILRLFREWTGNVHLAVLISAILFSALHIQFYGLIPRIALGILLGYLYVWTGSLWVPIFVHFMNNAMAVLISWLESNGLIEISFESFGSSDNSIIIAGSFLLTVTSMLVIYSLQVKRKQKKGPREEALE